MILDRAGPRRSRSGCTCHQPGSSGWRLERRGNVSEAPFVGKPGTFEVS